MKTNKISRILVPTDFSETGKLAVEHAAYMAQLYNAELFLVHLIEVPVLLPNVYEASVMMHDIDDVEKTVSEQIEAMSLKIMNKYDIKVKSIVETGYVASGISEIAKNMKCDIIVMGTHGASGFEEYFIGSNAQKTINQAPCPVITIQTHATQKGFRNIVMPIDNTDHSRQKVDHVIDLASKYISVVHILGLLNIDEDENKFNIKLDAIEKAIKKAGLPYERKIVKGRNIAIEAMKYSEAVKADLIVIMTDHESHLNEMLMGALAKQIVNHSLIPVMSIRPVEGNYESVNLSAASPF